LPCCRSSTMCSRRFLPRCAFARFLPGLPLFNHSLRNAEQSGVARGGSCPDHHSHAQLPALTQVQASFGQPVRSCAMALVVCIELEGRFLCFCCCSTGRRFGRGCWRATGMLCIPSWHGLCRTWPNSRSVLMSVRFRSLSPMTA
jgi:hypothetical protein